MRLLFLLIIFFSIESMAKGLCVRNSKAFLRKGPGTNYKKTWTVGKYMPFKKVKKVGAWVQVKDVDGDSHWGHYSLFTNAVRCVVVNTNYTNLRVGPGSRAAKADLEVVDRYKPFRRIERKGNWIHVEDDRERRYWVWAKNLWEPLTYHKFTF